jgi:serine/threonine protein kinase
LKFIAAACEDSNANTSNDHQRNEYLVLTELCKGGALIDFIRQNELNNEQVLQVFYQISKAVQFLHCQEPSIIHRDIKVRRNYSKHSSNKFNLIIFQD